MVTHRIVFFSFLFRNAHTPRLTAWLWSPVIRKQRKTLWYKPTSIGVHQSYKTYFSLQRWQTLLIHFFTLWTRNAVERKKQNKKPKKNGHGYFFSTEGFSEACHGRWCRLASWTQHFSACMATFCNSSGTTYEKQQSRISYRPSRLDSWPPSPLSSWPVQSTWSKSRCSHR